MVEIIDVEMDKIDKSLTVGKTPLERVVKLLSKLDSIRVSKDRGSLVSKEAGELFHKYVEQVESIFKNLPKPLKWRSFLMHDLSLLTDIPSNVQKNSVKHGWNRVSWKIPTGLMFDLFIKIRTTKPPPDPSLNLPL